ncbi:MAG: folylpolyglutamate synthase/dihydrofolate synthase family protein [candidate division WOR-3 bacterium]
MEFKEAVSFLYSLIDYEKKKGYVQSLDEYRNFLEKFDNPQHKLKNPILIVGTKGKGSTAHLLAGGLQSLGYKVGLYTSPHLIDIRERIKVNSQKIPEEKFAKYICELKPYIEGKRGIRTVFETLTLVAFLYFIEENTDFAILEAGLGGRLDATNVVNQLLTVITNISYDHMEILGNTLTKIAWEKAMVIKNSNPVIVGNQHPQVYRVIQKIADEHGARVYTLSKFTKYKILDYEVDKIVVEYKGIRKPCKFILNQGGVFQAKNIALSALALEVLGHENFNFESVRIEGRFEIISRNPLIIIDGAHNIISAKRLLTSISKLLGKEVTFIFGINSDKEVQKIVGEIVKFNPKEVIVTRSSSPRAEDPERLEVLFKQFNYQKVVKCDKAEFALSKAIVNSKKIIAFGSFYLAGEIKDAYQRKFGGI